MLTLLSEIWITKYPGLAIIVAMLYLYTLNKEQNKKRK